MIRLYTGSGASGFQLLEPACAPEQWEAVKRSAIELLRRRGQPRAAELLAEIPFEAVSATNDFNDPFAVLHTSVPIEEYVRFEALKVDAVAFSQIAKAIDE